MTDFLNLSSYCPVAGPAHGKAFVEDVDAVALSGDEV
jgi:hypothetical protein